MSRVTKKMTKKQPSRLNVLAASLMLMMPITHAANTVFSNNPLVGVTETFAPHVALALSVEFPTAGAAYAETTEFNLANGAAKRRYRGYFDNNKCYAYQDSDGTFVPKSLATSDASGNVGLCDGKTFSGNLLNFMTMSAIDIFRSTMTGGNRAKGTESEPTNYAESDDATYLRRANVVANQNGGAYYRLSTRKLVVGSHSALAKKLIPAEYVLDSGSNTGTPMEQGYKALKLSFGTFVYQRPGETPRKVYERRGVGDLAGKNDTFVDNSPNDITFQNDKFGFTIKTGIRQIYLNASQNAEARRDYGWPKTDNYETYTDATSTWAEGRIRATYEADSGKGVNKNFNVVVKVCDPSVGLESNCVQYGSHYKPEGLLQKNTREKGMRFATFGYLNIAGNEVDGGVLRSRMKKLVGDKETGGVVYGDEWDIKTGRFITNPDTTDASKSGVSNSGTINYLNKFGDASGYKTNDPAAELYYTALSYLMGRDVGNAPYQQSLPQERNGAAMNKKNAVDVIRDTPQAKDNFPVIYDWDDPYKRGIDDKQYQCHQSSIILIGDTNTHHDFQVPSRDKSAIQDYLKRLLAAEGNPFTLTTNVGSDQSPAYMAGMAYWARVTDIRSDIIGVQNGNNFIIDVVENGDYKANKNAYYLAAKYGGFNRTEGNDNTSDSSTSVDQKPLPLDRKQWTDDSANNNIAAFTKGTPRNYAAANNPDAMVDALEKAMQASGTLNNPSQAATGLSIANGGTVDFSDKHQPVLLQSTYNFAEMTGDIVAYNATYLGFNSPSLFSLKEKWRTGTLLNKYHNPASYGQRKVFTLKNNIAYAFNSSNASTIFGAIPMPTGVTAGQLANYVLGDNSLEESSLRKRSGLMGTVINSTAMPILKVNGNLSNSCQYSDLNKVKNRPTHYATASNDGMLHIFDEHGEEKMAYLASTAVPKLPTFASRTYKHQYLNDGTPKIEELCIGSTAKSVLIGTAGRGGASVYALDVTDLSQPSEQNVLWEFSNADDADLGYTVASPVMTKNSQGRPLAVVSSGYNNTKNEGHIFILDVSKPRNTSWVLNQNYWKIKLGESGVGAPFVYDDNADGIGDKIFVGDESGKVWQLDRDQKGDIWNVAYGGNPLFTQSADIVRPITGAPFADKVGDKLIVAVGTGRYFTEADLSAEQQNYVYGLFVNDKTPVDAVNLLSQEISTDVTSDTSLDANIARVYTVTENQLEANHQGWRLKLLQGQNISTNGLIRKRQVAEFTASRSTNEISEQCVRSGTTGYISVDVTTGGLNKRPVFDTNNDGTFDSKDRSVGLYERQGMNTPASTLFKFKTPSGATHLVDFGNDGSTTATPLKNQLNTEAGVRRISWREIF